MKRPEPFVFLLLALAGCSGDDAGADSDEISIVEQDGMMLVPAGPFTMGCDPEVDDTWCIEANDPSFLQNTPQREITLTYDYWIDKYEATRFDLEACYDAGACAYNKYHVPADRPDIGYSGTTPATSVSWTDAKTYCEWRGKRLPTEVEWEKAARGTDGRLFPWGNVDDVNELPECDTAHVIPPTRCGERFRGTVEVDAYPKDVSPYGVVGMTGNITEWCADAANSAYPQQMPATDPPPASEPDNDPPRYVVRGGYYDTAPSAGLTYNRSNDRDERLPWTGVRCVRHAD